MAHHCIGRLFDLLTRNAIETIASTNGTIIANMENNNFITYRLVLGSNRPWFW